MSLTDVSSFLIRRESILGGVEHTALWMIRMLTAFLPCILAQNLQKSNGNFFGVITKYFEKIYRKKRKKLDQPEPDVL